jgi:hypothetical protein
MCRRLVDVLEAELGPRLVCALLSGSWARGEARPGESDLDLTVVVDAVDDALLDSMRSVWPETGIGYVNVYGVDEIPSMSREAVHMYTETAVVLTGANPFSPPERIDYAADLASNGEVVARVSRHLAYAWWLTPEETLDNVRYLIGKSCFRRALESLSALREGRYPRSWEDLERTLEGTPEGETLRWLDGHDAKALVEASREVGFRLSALARSWYGEIAAFRAGG